MKSKKRIRTEIDYGGLSRREVANILCISEGMVGRIENNAIRKLKMSKKLYYYFKEPCDLNTFMGIAKTVGGGKL